MHLVPKPNSNEWRFTLATSGRVPCIGRLDGWPTPNIRSNLQIQYVQSNQLYCGLSPYSTSREVARGRAGPYFQRRMASEVLTRLIYRFCKLYIDNMLIHETTESEFLINFRSIAPVLTSHGSTPEEDAIVPSASTEDSHSGGTQVTTGYLVADFFPAGGQVF